MLAGFRGSVSCIDVCCLIEYLTFHVVCVREPWPCEIFFRVLIGFDGF
jgi:hypothetical protein